MGKAIVAQQLSNVEAITVFRNFGREKKVVPQWHQINWCEIEWNKGILRKIHFYIRKKLKKWLKSKKIEYFQPIFDQIREFLWFPYL